MKIKPMTRNEEIELTTPFVNDLNLVFGQLKQEMLKRIRSARSPQEAMAQAMAVLDEPFREEDNEE